MTHVRDSSGQSTERKTAVEQRSAAKHGFGFLVSGGIAFSTDALVLEGLMRFAGMHPLTARLFAIAAAIFVGWLCHRVMTFAVAATPSLREFLRYVVTALGAAVLNYAVYASLIMLFSISPFAALFTASAIAAIYSYISMKYFVFRSTAGDPVRPKTDV